ncbi:MAG: hypothetical protein WCJ58_06245 [bacterium]
MNIDDFVKIILAVSLSFAIVGIAFQVMRLISKVTDNMKELSFSIHNLNKFTERFIEDYDHISNNIKSFSTSISSIGKNIIDPLVSLFGFLQKFKK